MTCCGLQHIPVLWLVACQGTCRALVHVHVCAAEQRQLQPTAAGMALPKGILGLQLACSDGEGVFAGKQQGQGMQASPTMHMPPQQYACRGTQMHLADTSHLVRCLRSHANSLHPHSRQGRLCPGTRHPCASADAAGRYHPGPASLLLCPPSSS
jgi:hypothetical protein